MIYSVTYADDRMSRSASINIGSADKNGVDYPYSYTIDHLDSNFYENNKSVLEQDRGAGYWIWKPYVINKLMRKCKEGDILIYSDAGVEFVAPVQEIINRMDEDIFFFTNGWSHVEWCKADVFKSILGVDPLCYKLITDNDIKDIKQIQASVIFFKVNQKTRDFVKEWLLYCQFPGFIDDTPSKLPNFPTFAEHRHDQAIITCLAMKHGYTFDHWWPTQYSNHLPRSERDNYPVIFNHHRKRNNEW